MNTFGNWLIINLLVVAEKASVSFFRLSGNVGVLAAGQCQPVWISPVLFEYGEKWSSSWSVSAQQQWNGYETALCAWTVLCVLSFTAVTENDVSLVNQLWQLFWRVQDSWPYLAILQRLLYYLGHCKKALIDADNSSWPGYYLLALQTVFFRDIVPSSMKEHFHVLVQHHETVSQETSDTDAPLWTF